MPTGQGSPDAVPAEPGEFDVTEVMTSSAAWFVEKHDGAPLDYSRASLSALDAILGDLHDRQVDLAGQERQAAAAYVFEIARREFGGRYLRFDEDNPLVLVVGEPEFSVGLCAMSKVQGRVVNGPEDDIPFFYAGFVDAVSRRTSATVL